MKVREVFPSTADGDFVELQMFSAGQNVVSTHEIEVYDGGGLLIDTVVMGANVANGENQRTVLIGDSDVVGPDFTDNDLNIPAVGGAVCFPDGDPADCLTWGTFVAQVGFPNSQSAHAAGSIPSGMSLTRSIAPGCATLLEASDDTDNSLNDFQLTTPSPRGNGTAPTETQCVAPPPDPPPPAASPTPAPEPTPDPDPPPPLPPPLIDTIAPNTVIDKAPKGTIDKDKARISFSSNEPGSLFACKLDKAAYKPCTSPKTYRKLDEGRHAVLVRATDAALNTDPTPAKATFKVDTASRP